MSSQTHYPSDLTTDSELVSTPHDRQRRQERGILKDDLQRARRYGMVEPARGKNKEKWHHEGRVLVVDAKRNQIITSYGAPSRKKAGTAKYTPVLLKKSAEHDNNAARKDHNSVKFSVLQQKDKWKSHTILVVDMSGSMRTDDVNGARCRSDGVWTVLARDFLMKRLEEATASIYDVVSIILMKEPNATVFCRFEPMTWVLYNKLVDLREWRTEKPSGGGCYLPALAKAKDIFAFNPKCPALGLIFVSDGKPSDSPKDIPAITATVGDIASTFGRRLVVSVIGMADKRKENFSIMKDMTNEAKSFMCTSVFTAPDLNTASLSSIVHSSSTSMATTQTEMTDLRTGKLRTVRTDVMRERNNAPEDLQANSEWDVFLASDPRKYTRDVYVWHSASNDFATLINPRCFSCSKLVQTPSQGNTGEVCAGLMCPRCRACYMCFECLERSKGWFGNYDWSRLKHDCLDAAMLRRNGLIVQKALPSFSVAKKKRAFGEGAERLAFKFRFVGTDGRSFIGPKMVAKESRFVETNEDAVDEKVEYLLSDRFSYHRQFMRTHAIASRFAAIYNQALDSLPCTVITSGYPRIRFLDPMVFELEETVANGTRRITNILVEPMIEGTYRKYNSNNGKVGAVAPSTKMESTVDDLDKEDEASRKRVYSLLHRGKTNHSKAESAAANHAATTKTDANVLGAIEEGSEEETDSENEDDRGSPRRERVVGQASSMYDHLVVEDGSGGRLDPNVTYKKIRDEDFAQAFSHYTYVRSKGQLMVVDLQGTLRTYTSDKTTQAPRKEFILTDPAIHKRKSAMGHQALRQLNFGRTNRGRKGINEFWESHVCNDACRVLGLRPQPRYGKVGTAIANHETRKEG